MSILKKAGLTGLAFLAAAGALGACTEAQSDMVSNETSKEVTCYSGGEKVYQGQTSGLVGAASSTPANYVFKDATGASMSVPKAQCYIKTI